jgi:squalene-hopene/tetraprenyl-beta-curcumene cyclase
MSTAQRADRKLVLAEHPKVASRILTVLAEHPTWFLLAGLVVGGCGPGAAPSLKSPATPDNAKPAATTTSPPRAKLSPAEKSLHDAAEYLFGAQQDDGSWPSDYKQLEGAAITSLVLYALSYVPPEARPAQFGQRTACAAGYLLSGVEKKGYVVRSDGTPDYPTYATALTLIALRRLKHDLAAEDREKLIRYLLVAQLTQERGFAKDGPHHGGWDMPGDPAARAFTTGTNISATCQVLEALSSERRLLDDKSAALADDIDAALVRGEKWLAGCHDSTSGGYFFSPDPADPMNKAGWEDEGHRNPRAYGTATCDGLRSLLYCGVKLEDPRALAALSWLEKHDGLKVVPGFEKVPELGWQDGLRFYYYATLSKLLAALPLDKLPKHRQALAETVRSLQQADGRWQNSSDTMRENDPIVATALAIVAISSVFSDLKASTSLPAQ